MNDREANDLFGPKNAAGSHLGAITDDPTYPRRASRPPLHRNEEVRDWYSKDGNPINCKMQPAVGAGRCGTGKTGNPDTITKLKQELTSMQARGYARRAEK